MFIVYICISIQSTKWIYFRAYLVTRDYIFYENLIAGITKMNKKLGLVKP